MKHNHNVGIACAVSGMLLLSGNLLAAEDGPMAIEELNIEDILNMNASVATRQSKPVRESPSVITVVTREEMMATGARDLLDVLHMIPGFHFASDVQGVVSVGFRGEWGEEGKVLLMLDGMEINEPLYGTTEYGNRFPVDIMQRVEVIRGPGSAVYGGYAELAVVNIITLDADTLDGVGVSLTNGQFGSGGLDGFARRNVALAAAHKFDMGLKLSFTGAFGYGNRSDLAYTELADTAPPGDGPYTELNNEATAPSIANLGIEYGDTKLRILYENYRMTDRSGFSSSFTDYINMTFPSVWFDLQHTLHFADNAVTVTPRLNYRINKPWNVVDDRSQVTDETGYQANLDLQFYDKTDYRWIPGITVGIEPTDWIHILAGVQAWFDHATLDLHGLTLDTARGLGQPYAIGIDAEGNPIPSATVDYQNYIGYGQILLDTSIVNVTVGARYEYHSRYQGSFVPRLGLTKVIGSFHAKLLLAQAFRSPVIENISTNYTIVPEKTNSAEAEIGFQMTDWSLVTANVFYLKLTDAIAYDYIGGTEIYVNNPQTGAVGAEVQLVARAPEWGFANLSYAYYDTANMNQVPEYALGNDSHALIGFANHKFTFNSSFHIVDHLSIAPTAIVLSPRRGFLYTQDNMSQTGWTGLVNLFVWWRDIGNVRGLDLGVGAYNIFAANLTFVQAYNTDGQNHAPIPGLSREYLARLSYTFENVKAAGQD